MKRTELKRKTPLKAKASGIKPRTPRQKTCANPVCGQKFTPVPGAIGQKVCTWQCGLAIADQPENQRKARVALEQLERREIQVRKKKLKSKGDHTRETQSIFNEWVRERDRGLGCVSCDAESSDSDLLTGSRWDAGHYRSVGACPELRFEPLNVHRQCVKCNQYLSGNVVEYRIRLVKKIGADAVAWLEGTHEPKKYTIEDLQQIKAHYRALLRELQRGRA
ncbi:Bacteriophage Lambda NinG protein [Pseudomonas flavescens]|uniref:Bacteriophage Lambda NinG protein n=1 Tax=Phytopseudomonas flavescens TaxID=29435 RepID=A0A1G7XQD7_9GAMM|nr:recombination protein NinG [Pseudomonas flavescens]SDG86243.1 Bacteriophage Lambda NinG protein [Pseudomonas flavescens]